jgi:glycosyltransferase involved in cell wall biosynthesis
LVSTAQQRDVDGLVEVVVTDDGSIGPNRSVVAAFAREVNFPVKYTTHAHDGFRLARCRNEGVAVSTAPYLLFTDGDCVMPPDHLRWHLEYRRAGRVVAGDCYRLSETATEGVTEETIQSGAYLNGISPRERRRLAGKAFRAWWYQLLRCAMLPRLTGNNIGVWRTDYEQVNGFDENFVGWGLEDRDLQRRLSLLGLRFKSILRRTATCHLWHPPAPTFARNNVGTRNLEYYQRADVSIWCRKGLAERIRLAADTESSEQPAAEPDLIPMFTRASERTKRRAA